MGQREILSAVASGSAAGVPARAVPQRTVSATIVVAAPMASLSVVGRSGVVLMFISPTVALDTCDRVARSVARVGDVFARMLDELEPGTARLPRFARGTPRTDPAPRIGLVPALEEHPVGSEEVAVCDDRPDDASERRPLLWTA